MDVFPNTIHFPELRESFTKVLGEKGYLVGEIVETKKLAERAIELAQAANYQIDVALSTLSHYASSLVRGYPYADSNRKSKATPKRLVRGAWLTLALEERMDTPLVQKFIEVDDRFKDIFRNVLDKYSNREQSLEDTVN